jgi:hypothetical protein
MKSLIGVLVGVFWLGIGGTLSMPAQAHSEGTEASDPSSATAVLSFDGAIVRYAALETGLKPWRLPRPAASGPADHAGHAMPAEVEVRKPVADSHAHHAH